MKLLFDANISIRAVQALREEGFDVLSIQDIQPNETDIRILSLAVKQKRVLVTYDKDFGDLVFRDKHRHSGIVILRTGDEYWKTQATTIKKFLQTVNQKELAEYVWIVTDKGIRKR